MLHESWSFSLGVSRMEFDIGWEDPPNEPTLQVSTNQTVALTKSCWQNQIHVSRSVEEDSI